MGRRPADSGAPGSGAPGRATPALAVVLAAGVAHRVHQYEPAAAAAPHDRTRHPAYGKATAAALGIASERIFKTLVASVDGGLVVGVVPVAGELDLKALATAVGGRRAELADPGVAERATGYVIGGISPLGQRRQLPTVLDVSAGHFDTILVSAGRRGLQVELAPADLATLAQARVARIARPA